MRQQFLYTGKEFDEETGLTYFGARYYDSRHARWLSTDPMFMRQNAIGLNVYQYGLLNPKRHVDIDGMLAFDVDGRRWVLDVGDTLESVSKQVGMKTEYVSGNNPGLDWGAFKQGDTVVIPQIDRIVTFQAAASMVGDYDYTFKDAKGTSPAKTWKCNLFVSDMVNKSDSKFPQRTSMSTQKEAGPVSAGDLGDASKQLKGLTLVDDPKIGDVVGFKKFYFWQASGHSVIFAGEIRIIRDGIDVRAQNGGAPGLPGTIGANGNEVVYRTMKYLAESEYQYNNPVYRRLSGEP